MITMVSNFSIVNRRKPVRKAVFCPQDGERLQMVTTGNIIAHAHRNGRVCLCATRVTETVVINHELAA